MTAPFTNDQILPQEIPHVHEISFESLHISHRLQIRFRFFLLSFFLLVGLFFSLAFNGLLFRAYWFLYGLGAWLALVVFFWFFSSLLYNRRQYAVREHDISFKSGVIYTRMVTVPFHRIQHCDISRGPMDQLLDLSKLNIYTAGGASSDLTIPGLEEKLALRLKAMILHKTGGDEEE